MRVQLPSEAHHMTRRTIWLIPALATIAAILCGPLTYQH